MNPEYDRNVFFRCFAYRPRRARSPEEDYLTEAYAAVLLSDTVTAAAVLTELFGIPIPQNFRLRTQYTYERSADEDCERVDMKFWNGPRSENRFIVVQENKVSADFGDQINRYQRCLRRDSYAEFDEKRVVSCRAYGEVPSSEAEPAHIAIRWANVYEAIEQHLPHADSHARILWLQFLGFLESKGMKPFQQLDQSTVDALQKARCIREQLWQLYDQVVQDLASTFGFSLVPNSKRSDTPSCVGSQSFSCGDVVVQPFVQFDEAGIRAVLQFSNQRLAEIRAALGGDIAKNQWGNFCASRDFDDLGADFFALPGEEQAKRVCDWYKGVLDSLRRATLLPPGPVGLPPVAPAAVV